MRSGRGAVRAFDPAGLNLGSGDGAEETEVGAGFQTWQKEQTSADFWPPAEVFGGGKENKFARA